MGTQRYLVGKIGQALITLLFILTFNFFLFRILPGDPIRLLTKGAGQRLTPAEQQEMREELGVDKPVFPGQYVQYMGQTFRLDLGVSSIVAPGEDVTTVFFEEVPEDPLPRRHEHGRIDRDRGDPRDLRRVETRTSGRHERR